MLSKSAVTSSQTRWLTFNSNNNDILSGNTGARRRGAHSKKNADSSSPTETLEDIFGSAVDNLSGNSAGNDNKDNGDGMFLRFLLYRKS